MKLRPADLKDARRLFDWRNDPVTRSMSVTTAPVEWDGHLRWLSNRLSRADPSLYIAEADAIPIGTVRIDGDDISYTVAPEFRGQGFAVKMLALARSLFGPKRAEIKPGNVASIKAAKRAGHIVVLLPI